MDALTTLGSIAGGIMEGQRAIEQDKMNAKAIEVQDSQLENQKMQRQALEYDMQEKAKHRDYLDSVVPFETLWPGYKDNPTTMKLMTTLVNKGGLGNQVKSVAGELMITNRAHEWLGKQLTNNIALMSAASEARSKDLENQYIGLSNKINKGQDEEGNKYKPEQLQMFDQKRKQVLQTIADVEKAKGKTKEVMAEFTLIGKDSKTGKSVFANKQGSMISGGMPYFDNGNIQQTAELQRTSNNFSTTENISKTGDQKDWDGLPDYVKKRFGGNPLQYKKWVAEMEAEARAKFSKGKETSAVEKAIMEAQDSIKGK